MPRTVNVLKNLIPSHIIVMFLYFKVKGGKNKQTNKQKKTTRVFNEGNTHTHKNPQNNDFVEIRTIGN